MIPRIRIEAGLSDIVKSLSGSNKESASLFKDKLSANFKTEHIMLAPSGHGALYYILKALPQKKVFVPAYTCNSVVEAIMVAGKEPVYVDVDKHTLNMGAAELSKRIARNSIVLATHQFGNPCDIEDIERLCGRNDCVMVEDSAAAIGSKIGSRQAGTFGAASILSFDFTKTVTAARGGAAIFRDGRLHERAAALYAKHRSAQKPSRAASRILTAASYNALASPALYGLAFRIFSASHGLSEYHGELCLDFNHDYTEEMAQFQCSLGARILSRLKTIAARRLEIAKRYVRELDSVAGASAVKIPEGAEAVMIRFPLVVECCDKYKFHRMCAERGVDLGVSFSYSYGNNGEVKFPNAKLLTDSVLNMPIYSSLTHAEQSQAISVVKEAAELCAKAGQSNAGCVARNI